MMFKLRCCHISGEAFLIAIVIEYVFSYNAAESTLPRTGATIIQGKNSSMQRASKDHLDFSFQNGDNYEHGSGNLIIINVRVPDSCCASASNKELCKVVPTAANGVFVEGCFAKVKDQIRNHIDIVGGVSIAVIIIMVVNLFLSVYLCTCGLESDDDERPRRKFYSKSRQTDRV